MRPLLASSSAPGGLFSRCFRGLAFACLPLASLQAQLAVSLPDSSTPNSTAYDTSGSNNPITFTVASGNAALSGVISGPGGVIKDGAGTLILAAANTFTGGLTLSAGTLTLKNTLAQISGTGIQNSTGNIALNVFGSADGGTGAVQGAAGTNGANVSTTTGGNATGGGLPVSLGDSATLFNSGTLTGGSGGTGGTALTGFAFAQGGLSGAGAGGLVLGQSATLTNHGTITGGAGGAGGAGESSATGGATTGTGSAGSAGGIAAIVGNNSTVTNTLTLAGGAGGTGGNGATSNSTSTRTAGAGGAGGAGLVTGSNSTVTTSHTITGGNGGNAGTLLGSGTKVGGDGGAGGNGVTLGGGSTLTNSAGGSITGGSGGTRSATATAGAGGAGISGSNLTVINSGNITGGVGGDSVRANAITFGGTTNTLQLLADPAATGSLITGNIVAGGSADTLILGGNSGSITFDASQLSSSTSDQVQYRGFEALVKNGTGTWVFTGDSTFAGTTTVSAGTLQIGNGATSGSFTGNIVNNATVSFNRSDASTYSGSISGTGSLAKLGSGTLTLTGTSTSTGGTTVSAGTLQIGNGGTTGSLAGNITDNAALAFNRSDDVSAANVISGTGSLTKLGNNTLTFTGNNSYSGGTIVSAGTLQIGNGGTSGAISGSIADNGALIFNRSDPLTYAGDISGSGTLTKLGAGTLTLTGNSSYSGGATVSAGTLSAATAAALGTGNYAIASGAKLDLGAQNLDLAGTTAAQFSGAGTVATSGTFTANLSTDLTSSLNLGGTGAVTKTGSASLTLTGANSYSGGTTVSAGTLAVANGGPLGSGTLTLDGGTIAIPNFYDLNRTIVLGAGGGTFDITNSATTNAAPNAGGISGTGNLTKTGPGTLVLRSLSANSYTGDTIIEEGTLTVVANAAIPSRSNVIVNSAGTFYVNSLTQTIASLSGDGSVKIALGGTLNAGANGASTTFSGTIFGGGNLTKQGGGTLTLTGTNSAGAVSIQGGTLSISSADQAGRVTGNQDLSFFFGTSVLQTTASFTDNQAILLAWAGTFEVLPGVTTTLAGSLSGASNLIKTGGGTLALTQASASASTYAGGATVSGGTLSISADYQLGSDAIPFTFNNGTLQVRNSLTFGRDFVLNAAASTFAIDAGQTATLPGSVSGTGGLAKTGSGTLTLTGNNTWSGPTSVTGGELKLNGTATSSAFTVSGGGVLSGNATVGSLRLASGGILSPGNSPGQINAGATEWDGGSTFKFEVRQGTGGVAGTDWDLLSISGALTLSASGSNRITVGINTLDFSSGNAGVPANFTAGGNYSFVFVTTTGGIAGFDPADFILDTSGVSSALPGAWSVALGNSGKDLDLIYDGSLLTVPEPAAWAALAGAGALGLALRRRSKRRHSRAVTGKSGGR